MIFYFPISVRGSKDHLFPEIKEIECIDVDDFFEHIKNNITLYSNYTYLGIIRYKKPGEPTRPDVELTKKVVEFLNQYKDLL